MQLERPFRIDQLVIINAELAEILTHQGRVFGRDPEGPPSRLELGRQINQVHDMADVDPALGHGDGQPATAVAEVGRDHQGCVRFDGVLGEDVHPGHP
jgi:hypothetical protein